MSRSLAPALASSLDRLARRLQELDAALADPAVAADNRRFRDLSREHAEVSAVCDLAQRHTRRQQDLVEASEMLQGAGDDADLRTMAQEEVTQAEADLEQLIDQLQTALLPRDPDDARPAFLEIRAGTGGEESALFAADLARMYTRFAERKGWRCEVMSASDSDLGGYKEIVLRLEAERPDPTVLTGVYGQLKFESGGHRVQRVPATESQGRIHTSACTVAVLPEPDEAQEVQINPADLRIDTYRASGAGGQHINKTDSAVRITHIPTGIVAECQDDRSQHRNKAKALAVLAARIRDQERIARQAKEAATRKGLVGSGDRSDRIRTYNFPQGRLTDHRINLTLYKLGAVMEGELGEVIAALLSAQAAEQLAELEAAHGT
ncbi:peptide chain release factor 1 [Aquabacterium parvum]|uniref:peptide chain release factor 1 n=1 Tax=Aquabacterium parvum TaxID=70584 RepID=UPI000718BAAB|nr:peptide chain release factor 1 [Aquabacterium parvum]MBU0917155.1 peptide chain release factor 1 [Gammaproteobacteria bacterium]